ncbi:ATP-binding protein [Proteiniclasticum sp. QWL-01]|uniref:DEAD/DEAH box helicase n=1 Tax=Proteiniclasticum sp. QWL-01 TaxID=3036945 RepID=UPI002410BF1A|nr:ATP-binding protein [Proteiniclasticum sp. QWL-01]WFF73667.1 ATP-binding protein [Proteiniclasticum sp. QWL-01]
MIDKQQAIYFEDLTVNREEGAKALEGFALRGVKNSVVEKYSDQAHFIYELLQNADDAKATSARFELFKDKLVFAHNGTRRFSVTDPATEAQDLEDGTLGDINAITAVGGSNKTDEATIGKFGVGFKAVFQYTSTPHIYDPNVFFKIERFIVPIRLEQDYLGRRDGETLFVFPFDHDKRSPEESYADISEKLRSLDYPLLFLSSLKDIEFEISGILGLYGKTVEEKRDFDGVTAEFIRLTQNDGENREDLYDNMLWLFTRDDENAHTYSVGYFIDGEGHLIPKSHTAFCFFPTKEVTGLNFILHAPFLLTDSREGIRAGVQHNLSMIALLSELAADSLVYLRDIGLSKSVPLIDDNIFDIVPYDDSGFGDITSKKAISFKPFYTAIKEAFASQEIIPTLNNGYVTSSHAFWGGGDNSQLAEVFSNYQLAVLTKNEKARWAFPSLSTPRSAGKSVKFDYIRAIVENIVTDNAVIDMLNKSFIEAQKIEWLHTLYKYISVNADRTKRVKTKPIFLDAEGKAAEAYDSKDQAVLFLPLDGGSGFRTINEFLMQNEETLEFIKRIGVSEPSLRDEIYTIILPRYKDGVSISTKPDFKKFFQYYLSCPLNTAKSFLDLLRGQKFVLCQREGDKTQYRAIPNGIYFPFEPLPSWFAEKPEALFVCFDEYIELLGNDKREDLVRFLSELGVKDTPRILLRILTEDEAYAIRPRFEWQQPAYYNMNTRKWSERYIDGCKENIDRIVANQDVELSIMVWNQLLKLVEYGVFKDRYSWSHDSILYGKYEYFYRSQQTDYFDSNEAKRLRTQPWLLNANGEFVSTSLLTVQTLNPQYNVSNDEALELFRILGIKEEVEELIDDDIDIASFAESYGYSEEDVKRLIEEDLKRRKAAEEPEENFDFGNDDDENEEVDGSFDGEGDIPIISKPSIKRVGKEITKRATSTPKERLTKTEDATDNAPTDEDDYSKPTVDISKKIEKVKEQAEREIQEIARLEDLKQQAEEADVYSFGWFKALLELESLNSGENNANSREISISFAKVEREEGTSRTLILKHPNRYIPQSMEDLADIPLELHFAGQPMVKVAVEVVSVKSYTLRAKLRTNAQIDDIDLSQVTEARIEACNPVFLIEELRKAFIRLGEENGYDDDYDMQSNLCENIEFVFGPPGTGKTTHVARDIILPLMKSPQDLNVLVLTPTNKSADVLVRRLMECLGSDHSYINWLVRFGATNDNTIEQSDVFRDKTFDIRTFPRNVTVTTIARFPYDYFLMDDGKRLTLSGLMWDYIIIDEASMIPLANIVYPLYKKTPEKFIIAGDPFQIEPITTVDTWKNENIYTMVELKSFTETTTVPHNYHVELLTTQYRSIPGIGEVFSQFAYGGVLKHYRTAESQRTLPIEDFIDLKPLNIIKFPVSKFESIYRPKRLQSKTPYQVYSALFAFEFMKYLTSLIEMVKGDEDFRIGLIAPYRAQADLIDKLMTSVVLPKNVDVQVGTIHGFQGDECDIIIALFNPPPKISTHKDMFLNKLNIVNVSISRARDYLIVLMPDDETENINNLTLIKKVERLCKEQPDWVEQLSPEIEELIFGSKSYLEDNSFSTSHQLVNVYEKPEKRYEVRSEDNAVDVQIHN